MLAFAEARSGAYADIFLLPLQGNSKSRPLFDTAEPRYFPAFSPDGRWIAYVSVAGERAEVFVVDYPRGARSFQISTTGGWGPLWSPDGRELFYWQDYCGTAFMTVPRADGFPYRLQKSSILFRKDQMMSDYVSGRNYDIAPDGQRFLMLKNVSPEFKQINVVLNWFEELKRLCPTGR